MLSICYPPPPLTHGAKVNLVGQVVLIVEALRSHSDTPQSEGLL